MRRARSHRVQIYDEAHHGFGKDTLAAKFFREVLQPEFTILITATPDDADVKGFEKAMSIKELQRIRVSRADVVDVGLIKAGVKCVAYFVEPDKAGLVDLQGTALRDAVLAHRGLKQELARLKVPLVPLLLVQADSTEKSVEKLKDRLLRMGFTENQIAIHTAAEPDSGLLALANDERREVLIFKMAVALGFDAPRAFMLVSMRASRDPDFGVQLVGRILRVHRRLQGRAEAKTLPEKLRYGYVFLADAEMQTGLDLAGQKINQIQTEYAKVSRTAVTVQWADGTSGVVVPDASGQLPLFRLESVEAGSPRVGRAAERTTPEADEAGSQAGFDFGQFFDPEGSDANSDEAKPANPDRNTVVGAFSAHRYPLRADAPRRFKTQVVSAQVAATEEDCANRFMVSTRELFDVLKNKISVERRTLEVFTSEIQAEFNFAADLSPGQAAKLAQAILLANKVFDPRELRRALLGKVESVLREEAMSDANEPERVRYFLDVILALRPQLLRDAQKAAINQHSEIQETDHLPGEIDSLEPLARSPRNVYGVMPTGLNSWEKKFAERLDGDPNGLVLWWHRNPPHKPWSVNVLMPDGRGFYPDFVVGIRGRRTEQNALLADPKLNYQRDDEAPKVLAAHGTYGRVMILFLDDRERWMTVGYDHGAKKPIPEREFRLTDAAGFQ